MHKRIICFSLVLFFGSLAYLSGLENYLESLRTTSRQVQLPAHATHAAVRGFASWYGPGFEGKRMANGQVFHQREILVAHRDLPLGTRVRILNLENGRSIIAVVKDRGPYVDIHRRQLDVSRAAARLLGMERKGIVLVEIQPL